MYSKDKAQSVIDPENNLSKSNQEDINEESNNNEHNSEKKSEKNSCDNEN